MRAVRRSILLVLVLASVVGCSSDALEDAVTGLYFVKVDSATSSVAGLVTDLAQTFEFEPIHIYDSASEGFTARLPRLIVPDIAGLTQVEYVQEDQGARYEPPAPTPDQMPMTPPASMEVTDGIRRIDGPAPLNAMVQVAVIDTGVDQGHPDLNVVAEFDAVGERTGDFANGTDPDGHGTHVAGTIAARSNGMGVLGVSPGVGIHAVRVLGSDGSGTIGDVIAGLEYVLDHPEIRVVNMSLGGPRVEMNPDPLQVAIQRLVDSGVIVVVAAGNEGQDTDNVSPAGYNIGVVVSAYDSSGGTDRGFASFSNYGDEVDVSAPGVNILSSFPGGMYQPLSGTSMATPHVAGAAAAYVAANPNATPQEFYQKLIQSSETGYTGQGGSHPEPLLNVSALLQ